MKKFLLGICLLSFLACNSDHEPSAISQSDEEMLLMGESVDIKGNTLSFSSQASFENVVKGINEAKLAATKSGSNTFVLESKFSIEGFRSLFDVYTDALNEAEKYYSTYEKYQEFKNKYSQLYFPEVNNDYSAFLPVSDEGIAKILNPNGEVIIAGETRNMKDVNTYEQLSLLGKTMPDEDVVGRSKQSQTRAEGMIVCSQINGQGEVAYNPAGDRKLWVYITNGPSTNPTGGYAYQVFFEVCFRQKGFLGIWYNYTSKTNLRMNGNYMDSKSGMSSHDYYYYRRYDNSGNLLPFGGYADIWYQGFIDVIYRINVRFNY